MKMTFKRVARRTAAAKSEQERDLREFNRRLDEESLLSFPASDPPAYMGSVAIPGRPPQASLRAAARAQGGDTEIRLQTVSPRKPL
jgi:hypothetical protein